VYLYYTVLILVESLLERQKKIECNSYEKVNQYKILVYFISYHYSFI